MNKEKTIYGYVFLNEQKIPFVIENYIGRIFNGVTGISFGGKTNIPEMLYGVTDENYNIAIKVANSRKATNCIIFSIIFFVIGSANCTNYDLSKFKKIVFTGGTLNSIIDPTKIYCEEFDFSDPYKNPISIKFKAIDEVSTSVATTIHSQSLIFHRNIIPYAGRKNNELGVTNSQIKLDFNIEQGIASLDYWIRYIHKLLSLFVRQQNVKCDEITIILKTENGCGNAKIYYKNSRVDFCEKKYFRCLAFDTLDKYLVPLLQAIDNDEFSVNFLPENNTEARYISYEDIKNTCTALEYEFANSKIKVKKDEALKPLITSVKETVGEYKEGGALSDKSYNYIMSNISTWSAPAAEQFVLLYQKYKDVLDRIFQVKRLALEEEDILNYVKFRNRITHGEKPPINNEIANTSYCLEFLIYACIFGRIGLTNDEIVGLLQFVS